MDLDETIQREQVEFEKAAVQREKVEARKAKLEALRPPSTQAARAAGLSDAEMRARILDFMLVLDLASGLLETYHRSLQELQG